MTERYVARHDGSANCPICIGVCEKPSPRADEAQVSIEVKIAYSSEVNGPGTKGLRLSPCPWISVDGRPWRRADERSLLRLKGRIVEAVESLAVEGEGEG